jgi:hypothetical protein
MSIFGIKGITPSNMGNGEFYLLDIGDRLYCTVPGKNRFELGIIDDSIPNLIRLLFLIENNQRLNCSFYKITVPKSFKREFRNLHLQNIEERLILAAKQKNKYINWDTYCHAYSNES